MINLLFRLIEIYSLAEGTCSFGMAPSEWPFGMALSELITN